MLADSTFNSCTYMNIRRVVIYLKRILTKIYYHHVGEMGFILFCDGKTEYRAAVYLSTPYLGMYAVTLDRQLNFHFTMLER